MLASFLPPVSLLLYSCPPRLFFSVPMLASFLSPVSLLLYSCPPRITFSVPMLASCSFLLCPSFCILALHVYLFCSYASLIPFSCVPPSVTFFLSTCIFFASTCPSFCIFFTCSYASLIPSSCVPPSVFLPSTFTFSVPMLASFLPPVSLLLYSCPPRLPFLFLC